MFCYQCEQTARGVGCQTVGVCGKPGDVALGFDNLDGYLTGHPFFGCIAGRYANRIGQAKFTLGGKTYELAKNDHGNTLHGGLVGFDKKVWRTKELLEAIQGENRTYPDGPDKDKAPIAPERAADCAAT